MRLSAESAVKQVINHPDLTTVRRGWMLRESDGRHLAFLMVGDSRYSYKAVLKTDIRMTKSS